MSDAAPHRIEALDLIRGIAVLGILAINIAGFAGPSAATLTPHLPSRGTFADEVSFAVGFVLFEGKMRALFCLLFGASLVLFVERSDARGAFGDLLQMRRLGWLALIGLLHFYVLWWGDILFILAISGIIALLLREIAPRSLAIAGVVIFAIWHATGIALSLPDLVTEERVRLGIAAADEFAAQRSFVSAVEIHVTEELAAIQGSFADQMWWRIAEKTFQPFATAFTAIGETLPLMMLGMAMQRSGFFAGTWPRGRMTALAWIGTVAGLALTLAMLAWAWPRDFPIRTMEAFYLSWTAFAHLPMALGYAAILVLAAPTLAATAIGSRLVAAGRMAFSNYIATTLAMTAVFYGWGLGLAGRVGAASSWPFVIASWLVMLAWSKPWLARFRRGPLEWAWRSLVEMRLLSNRY